MKKIVFTSICLLVLCYSGLAQTLSKAGFSALAVNNNSFKPVAGMPYNTHLAASTGSLTISSTVGDDVMLQDVLNIKDQGTLSDFVAYPNPATDEINVVDKSQKHIIEFVQITSITGQVLKNLKEFSENELLHIDISDLARGVYILSIQGQDFIHNETIIKQ